MEYTQLPDDFLCEINQNYNSIKSKKKNFASRYYNMGVLQVKDVLCKSSKSKPKFCVFDAHEKKMYNFDLKKLHDDYLDKSINMLECDGLKFRINPDTENEIRDAYMDNYFIFENI